MDAPPVVAALRMTTWRPYIHSVTSLPKMNTKKPKNHRRRHLLFYTVVLWLGTVEWKVGVNAGVGSPAIIFIISLSLMSARRW